MMLLVRRVAALPSAVARLPRLLSTTTPTVVSEEEAGGPGSYRRAVNLRNLPWELDKDVPVDKATLQALLYSKGVNPAEIDLDLRAGTGRFNGAARAFFKTTEQAEEAVALLKGAELGGRKVLVKMCKPPAWVEPTDPAVMEEITREDPLQMFLSDMEERKMPTLETVRTALLENDQHDILRTWRLPGLTLPEWDDDPGYEGAQREKDEFGGDRERVRGENEVIGQWAETIVKVDRVQKVVKGGSIMKCRALVVVGNLMGAGGFAYGKGSTPGDAVARACAKAKQNLFFADRYRGVALAHDVVGKHNNCIVKIYATQPGRMMFGSSLGRRILMQMGFSSFTIKAHGRRNPPSVVYATFDALAKLASVAQIARKRGRRLLEIDHVIANRGAQRAY